jgi:hypothetical protein
MLTVFFSANHGFLKKYRQNYRQCCELQCHELTSAETKKNPLSSEEGRFLGFLTTSGMKMWW